MIQTPALQYIQSKGWNFKPSSDDKIELERCPFCKKDSYGHFYMVIEDSNRDGLWLCHRCGKQGNLTTLKEDMHDKIAGVDSRSDWAGKEKKPEPMPDIEAAHQALLDDADAMDYLVNVRGFSRAIIEKQKLGLTPKRFFRDLGEVRALMYPYLVGDNAVFVHWRSLPPSPKAFSSLKNWDAPLYNQQVINDSTKEIVMVEGEANTIAALDHGIENIVGVPGANFKKAMWIEQLDQIENLKVFICYDKDKVGQKAAQTLASRIGIQRCYKIKLPDFEIPQEDGTTKPGKDLNEWFVHGGGTKEKFEELKNEAVLFDVQGVSSSGDALTELEEQLSGKSTLRPTYNTPWRSLNKLIGFEDGDVIDIMAPEKIGKTTFGMNLMEHQVDTTGEDGLIICLEMTNPRMARKWVSHVAQVDDSLPKNDTDAEEKLKNLKEGIKTARAKAAARNGNLYFCCPTIRSTDDAYKLIVDCIRRYGVKWVMFDNLQLLCDRTLKNLSHRTAHLSQISKELLGITKEYNIKLLRILQPHRIRQGELATSDNVDGSSQVAKDCDAMIILDRVRKDEMSKEAFESSGYVESEQAFDSKMKATVGLSRYSSGGYVTLEFDGAYSTVREYDPMKIAKMTAAVSAKVTGNALPVETLITDAPQANDINI